MLKSEEVKRINSVCLVVTHCMISKRVLPLFLIISFLHLLFTQAFFDSLSNISRKKYKTVCTIPFYIQKLLHFYCFSLCLLIICTICWFQLWCYARHMLESDPLKLWGTWINVYNCIANIPNRKFAKLTAHYVINRYLHEDQSIILFFNRYSILVLFL